MVNELMADHNIDLFSLTETWLSHDEYISLFMISLLPVIPTLTSLKILAEFAGVAAIYNSALFNKLKAKLNYKSLERLSLNPSHPAWKTAQSIIFIPYFTARLAHSLKLGVNFQSFSQF